MITGRIAQVRHREGGVKLAELTKCTLLDVTSKFPAPLATPQLLRLLASERADHSLVPMDPLKPQTGAEMRQPVGSAALDIG